MLPYLSSERGDPALLIQQKQVAVPAHQLQNDRPADRIPWACRHLEFDHAFKTPLLQADESHLSHGVLNLLRQGAAGPLTRRCRNLHKAWCIRLPAELEPEHSPKASKPQLQCRAVGLLRLLESAGNQLGTQITEDRPQGGEIHHLQSRLEAHPLLEGLPTLLGHEQSVMDDRQGRLTVITGPSGVGKGTLVQKLLARHPQVWLSVSATTRSPRAGEQDGISYFFHTRERFDALVADGGLLEWAEFAGNAYGTPRRPVEQRLATGTPVLLEIELEGARQVRRSFPQGFQIFLAPPSFEELESRIRGRGTDSEEAIQRRLSRAREELTAQSEFDAVVVNDDLDQALLRLEELMGLS